MKKIDKEFCLTDNSVNTYGYRLLTEGLQLERFKPAIGFLMHEREKGPAVTWTDFRFDGDKLFAKPIVNDLRFPSLVDEIEQGFYAAASAGYIVALEVSENPEDMIAGQTGPTVTKWFPRECSIVDIPANYDALAKLMDESGHIFMDLSANINDKSNNNKKTKMTLPNLSATDLLLLGLKEGSTKEEISSKLSDLVSKAKRADELEIELSALKSEQMKEKVNGLLLYAKNKLTNEMRDKLGADYASNPEGLKSLLDAMPVRTPVTKGIETGPLSVPEKYQGKTLNDLFLSDELEDVKNNYPEYYQSLIKK